MVCLFQAAIVFIAIIAAMAVSHANASPVAKPVPQGPAPSYGPPVPAKLVDVVSLLICSWACLAASSHSEF